MAQFDEVDFFNDLSLVEDPFPYFEYLRSKSPVCRLPHHNVVAVTGYDEAVQVYNDQEKFSSAVGVTGPIPPLPFEPEGDDIREQLEQYRDQLVANNQIVTFDGKKHSAHRSLLARLFTPTRLRDVEEFIWFLADRHIDRFAAKGECELISEFATPYVTLVIADLLGVPESERQLFEEKLASGPPPSPVGGETVESPLAFLWSYFTDYVQDRRANPRDDILSELANASFPDGSMPTVDDIVSLTTFLFGAGQDTTAKLLGNSLRILAESPDVQNKIRDNHELIPDFIEEALRIDGIVKTSFRLATVSTSLAGVDIPAGTVVMMPNLAFNRDPKRFEAPTEFRFGRPNARQHLAFGRGAHTCIGAPLARSEVRIALSRLLDRLGDIRISEAHHGPSTARSFQYEPTYILRGLQALHLEFTAAT